MKLRLQFGFLLLLSLFGAHSCSAQVTPNLGLTLPAQNAPNWGVTLNNNFTIIDTFAGTVRLTWPPVNNIVISNGTNAPAGLAEVDGECVVGVGGAWAVSACAASANFSALLSGTNTTATMLVGTGASLAATGSGSIVATAMDASLLTGTTLASGVVTSSLTAVGTIGTGTWQGTVVAPTYGGTGVANTATLILGSSNQNWATIGTGIVKVTTITGAITDAASADVIALWTGTCNSTTFFRGDGACAAASAGDSITSPNSTLVVGGTAIATTLDLAGAAGKIMAGATPILTATPTLGVPGSSNGTLTLASITATGSITLTPASAASAFTVTIPAATDTLANLGGTQTLTGKTLTSPVLGGTPDASGATQFKLPVGAGYASAANGELGYDTTNKNWHVWANGVDNLAVLVPVSVTVVNGDCMQWVNVGSVITASDSGSACGSGGGGTAFSSLTNGTNTVAAMLVGTGASLGVTGTGTIAATSAPLAGISGLGTGVATFLGTPSSANLAAALTDETGTGAAVFANTPTLVTPVLGAATATSINKVAVTAPGTSATLTIANGAILEQTGAFTLNLTVAGNATPTFPTASDTVVELTQTQTLTSKTLTSPVLGGTPDASGATQFKLPVGAAFVSAANGELGYDTTNKNWHVWGNGVDNFMALVPVSVAPVNGDCTDWVVSGGVTTLGDAGSACGSGGGSSAWSSLTNPSASLTLSMGIHPTTFNFTSALSGAFLWANTTAATSSVSASSPILSLCGNAWHSGASSQDCLTFEDEPGNGTDAAGTFNIGHTGSSTGIPTTVLPGPVQAGSSGGVGGTINLPEGTAQSASANNDICYADSTLHGVKCSFNNTSFIPMVLSATAVVSGDAPSYNGVGGGLLQDSGVSLSNSSVAIPAGQCFSINGDSFLCRFASGSFEMGSTANSATGVLELADMTTTFKNSVLFTQLIGTTFTTSNGCSETGTLVGEGAGGHLTAETSIACSTTITMGGGASATHGWVCKGMDQTTKTNPVTIIPASVTTVTLSGTFLSGDVLWFSCDAV